MRTMSDIYSSLVYTSRNERKDEMKKAGEDVATKAARTALLNICTGIDKVP